MRLYRMSILVLLLFFNCSSNVYAQIVLTFVLSFGDEETITKNEFLLARPWAMAVNDTGDIFVVDENRVKVFDGNGKEKTIVGHPGQGPGEFQLARMPTISPTGFLTVEDGYGFFNVYDQNYKFITKVSTRLLPIYKKYLEKRNTRVDTFIDRNIYSFDGKRRILSYSSIRDEDPERTQHGIIYDCTDTLIDIAYYDVEDRICTNLPWGEVIGVSKPFAGRFYWDLLSGNRVVFIHTEVDVSNNAKLPDYILHIKSFEHLNMETIAHSYIPIEIPRSAKERYINRNSGNRNLNKISKDIAEKVKYYKPIQRILTDRNYIFVFTYMQNEKEEIFVDIFDADKGMYVNAVFFPFIPSIIKDNFAYRLNKNQEGFSIVENYKIDPEVYGK